MLVTLEYLDASFLWSKGAYVPYPDGVVHCVGEDVGAIGGQSQACHGVIVATHTVQCGVLT